MSFHGLIGHFFLLLALFRTETVILKELKSHSVVSNSLRPHVYSLPGSSVHGIFQAIVLEWIAISFSRGSSQPRDRTQVSRIADRHFTI